MYKDNNNLAIAWKRANLQGKRKIESLLIKNNIKFIDGLKFKNQFVITDGLEEDYKNSIAMSVIRALTIYEPDRGVNFFSVWTWEMRGAQQRFNYQNTKQYKKDKVPSGNSYYYKIDYTKKLSTSLDSVTLGGEPIMEKIAAETHEPEFTIDDILNDCRKLSPEERRVLRYKFKDELEHQQIADIMGYPRNIINLVIKSGIRKLRQKHGVI